MLMSRQMLELLLANCIRCGPVANEAVNRLRPDDFEPSPGITFALIWRVARDWIVKYGQEPPYRNMEAEITAQIGLPGLEEPEVIDAALRTLQYIYTCRMGQEINPDYGFNLLEGFLGQRWLNEVNVAAVQHEAQDGGHRTVRDLMEDSYTRVSVTRHAETDPFNIEAPPSFSPKEPFGLSFIDVLLGGGGLPGESYGILGPSSGGKTLLAVQWACAIARRMQHVLYLSYEQSSEDNSEMRMRALGCAASVSRTDFSEKKWEDMSEPVRLKLMETMKAMQGYFTYVDMSYEGGGSVRDIGQLITQHQQANKPPRLIICDWMWPMVHRIAATEKVKADDTGQMRGLLQRVMEELKKLAQSHKVNFLLVHQLSIAKSKMSPGAKPGWFDAAEAGSFAWLLNACFAIGTASSNGRCWLVASKTRGTAKSDLLMRLNGEYNRFDSEDTRMVFDRNKGDFVDESKQHQPQTASVVIGGSDEETEALAGGGGDLVSEF